MKQHSRKIFTLILALCLVVTATPAVSLSASAATGNVIEVAADGADNLRDAVSRAQDGDTVKITGVGRVNSASYGSVGGTSDPWVIDKRITITGGEMQLRTGGIVLGADVTFKDVKITVCNPVRSAIMANGHTLTLENVTKTPISWNLHLFCGGPTGNAIDPRANVPACGTAGRIIIKGSTTVDNIYAGSISTDGTANEYAGSTEILIDPAASGDMRYSNIYACGALETPVNGNWFDYVAGGQTIAPPTANAAMFRVTDDVTIALNSKTVRTVDGRTGGSRNAALLFEATDANEFSPALHNLSALSVKRGTLHPSALSGDGMELSIASGAVLRLGNTAALPLIGDFNGGGDLVLGQAQTLQISGAVNGKTRLFIDSNRPNDTSAGCLRKGHAYLIAPPQSDETSFTLAPADSETLRLVYSDGVWAASANDDIEPLLRDFRPDSNVIVYTSDLIDPNQSNSYFPVFISLRSDFAENGAFHPSMEFLPLQLTVNGKTTPLVPESEGSSSMVYRYVSEDGMLSIDFGVFQNETDENTYEDVLSLTATDLDPDNVQGGEHPIIPVPVGTYTISVTVPAENTERGEAITRDIVLTVADDRAADPDNPTVISVLPPETVSGLVYNGQTQTGVTENSTYYTLTGHTATNAGDDYRATASLCNARSGFVYQWNDGTSDPRTIPWQIAKAEGPAAPAGLTVLPPDAANGSGRIFGTTGEMEYSATRDFAMAADCSEQQTAVAPGTYYVRMKMTDAEGHDTSANYNVSYATVTVPDYTAPLTIDRIAINSMMHKTVYQVGDALDVSNLTLLITMSDGTTTYTVPVDSSMVSGFDSSNAADSQTLTVTYNDRYTTTYAVKIESSGGSGAGGSGGDNTGGGGGGGAGGAGGAGAGSLGAGTSTSAVSFGGGIQTTTGSAAAPETISGDTISGFADTQTHWAKSDIAYVVSKGIFKGTSDSTFSPDVPITRGMMVTLLGRIAEADVKASGEFSDVSANQYYAPYVSWAYQKGIVKGVGSGLFAPDRPITRQEMCAMLAAFAGYNGAEIRLDFTDADGIAPWAQNAVAALCQENIIRGMADGSFAPTGTATRAECAAILHRYLEAK